ncbi:protein SAR DEFICIENT 1-like isoform X2 [Panicum miliaceum]|uniref:Protein SAR DEFICIENT 1-like isoform X2 n=1 Tax=Panicum miliaceum TaxID=4540 RepID=A0A3L6T106_PANMI|nr:protein SAR DEFICIENT 1-like isoform X2 [Panicum miliaceum]
MEMERGAVEQPPAKRMKLAVPVGVGGGLASPRSRRLRQTLLVVLFLVRASARATVTASVSQIGGMRQLARLHSNHHPDRHTRIEPNQEHAASSGSNTNIHLHFLNNWKPPLYTDKDITDENNVAIKVAMFEGDKMITTGPLSKAEIEILVVHGSFYKKVQDNWTEEEFDKHIVQGRDEQRLVLRTVRLTNGEVELSQIRFKEGSCRKRFSMAARFCKSEKFPGRVREAIMEPVEVKDRRNEPNEKSNSPRLDDDVYRIEAIAKDGAYHQRLQEANIHTVEDFLKALNKDPDELYKILKMKRKGKPWSKMTGHARKRILEDRHELKAYQTDDGTVMLFFNCVHDLVGAKFGSNYIACEKFDIDHKASVKRMKEHVYNRLEDIPYDYVMKGDAPERISLGTGAAAGPSVVSVDARQPNSIADNLEAYEGYQGAGAAENCPSDGFNLVTEPIYTHANYGPMNSGPLNTYDCQGQGIPPPCHQQTTLPSIGPEWQQNAQVPTDSPDPFEWARMNPDMLQQSSGASTSAQPNLGPYHLPQLLQTVPAAAPAWTMAQPPFPGQDQGPGCSVFPGSGHGNGR